MSAEAEFLQASAVTLLVDQAAMLSELDWTVPEQVALAEKRGRILSVHRTNIEKILSVDSKIDHHTPDRDDTERLRQELHRRLVRHADRLGRPELARRLAERGIEPTGAWLASLGKDGSGDA